MAARGLVAPLDKVPPAQVVAAALDGLEAGEDGGEDGRGG
jgi:hypothetical protein